MLVGLYGNYDIDKVIRFFDSEGTVTFSNEMDKYYRFQILEQIDFERLARFRTATVKFHVQPFKYSVIEEERIFNVSAVNLMNLHTFTATSYGVTVDAGTNVSVSGTSTSAVEAFIPIDPVVCQGSYTFTATATGEMQGRACPRFFGREIRRTVRYTRRVSENDSGNDRRIADIQLHLSVCRERFNGRFHGIVYTGKGRIERNAHKRREYHCETDNNRVRKW